MMSSVPLPEVVAKYPRARKRLPRHRLPRSANSRGTLWDDRPLIIRITSGTDRLGGTDRNLCPWSGAGTQPTTGTPISAQVWRKIARIRCRSSPSSTLQRSLEQNTT